MCIELIRHYDIKPINQFQVINNSKLKDLSQALANSHNYISQLFLNAL